VIVVSDSSPLITLSRAGCLGLVRGLFPPDPHSNRGLQRSCDRRGWASRGERSGLGVVDTRDTGRRRESIANRNRRNGLRRRRDGRDSTRTGTGRPRGAHRRAEGPSLRRGGQSHLLRLLLEMDFRIDAKTLRSSLQKLGFKAL